ncbi:MAG: uracil-DNA glycosylase family protein [Alphaproteobacteria bacterium]|nr:MAG: uracil-DNA glycosylase family protein [Alphaproteobacteria bacterium]
MNGGDERDLDTLLSEIRACCLCADLLPHEPRPVLQAGPRARILVVGQAPGRRVHETGLPFNDPSGERLRDWMGIGRETFYDPARLNIVPMGFCYPGTDPKGGDRPPRPECAAHWRKRLLSTLGPQDLTLVIGQYAMRWHLGREAMREGVSGVVRRWREFAPALFPLPHPSPRNIGWFRRHPWFEAEVVPALRRRIAEVLGHPR